MRDDLVDSDATFCCTIYVPGLYSGLDGVGMSACELRISVM